MRRALRLAARAAGRTSPNPLVGSVVVKDGLVVGEGYHHAAGEPHAEVNALRKAGDAARGATLYTNLEPCAHHGRTRPCVDAIREAGIARVVVAMRDPDPRTDGKGIRGLRAAGVEVEEGLLREEAERLNVGFVSRLKRGRPFVLLKLATTVDGRVAVPGRRYLSGKPALREVHRLRDRTDAVLVGIGTVLADDPALTVREVKGRDPLRVIVDADARTPPTAKVVRAKDPQRTMIFVARDADVRRTNKLREAGVLLVTAPRADGGLDLGIDASVNVAGACLTVVERDTHGFAVDVVAETLSRTTLGRAIRGTRVNLESAATPTTALGGHFVQGHVDATAKLVARHEEGGAAARLRFALPTGLARYIVMKGFITLDGVSLTVAGLGKTFFEIALIPHTAERTTLGALASGDLVNVETDVLAKYVERLLKKT